MVSKAVSPLEIKSLDSKKAPKKSKSEDDSFKNEMLQNEKRMKMKAIDGREATGHTHGSRQPKLASAKEEPSTQSNRTTKQSPATSTTSAVNQNKASQETQEQAAPAVATAVNTELSQQMMTELQTAGMDVGALQKKEGKLSIEGMQLVQPQTLQAAVATTEPVTETSATADTLLSLAPAAIEQKPSDLLSQDSNQDLSGFNGTSELSSMQNTMIKENAPNQQAFAAVLDSKLQTPEQVREANVENMITQARTILKDGGGEMTLKLTPEGMGTVDLKVGVQNGQVSVEIITQDQNVKKMFEDSVFDMRGALESQNLKVDTFKVGVSEHYDQMMGQQNGAQQQFEEREFARDFMGQFRNERQGIRQQGIDSILNNRSPFNSNPEGLQPASAKNLNGRLNIIA